MSGQPRYAKNLRTGQIMDVRFMSSTRVGGNLHSTHRYVEWPRKSGFIVLYFHKTGPAEERTVVRKVGAAAAASRRVGGAR